MQFDTPHVILGLLISGPLLLLLNLAKALAVRCWSPGSSRRVYWIRSVILLLLWGALLAATWAFNLLD